MVTANAAADFIFDEDELPPELRAQRVLNKARIPEICGYILDNQDDYVFSALTVSIDSQCRVRPASRPGQTWFVTCSDGCPIHHQRWAKHRRAAIIEALEQRPELGHETIAVVFFLYRTATC